MKISKKRIKELRKELKKSQEKSKNRKPMRPVFFKRNTLCGGEIDWGKTCRYNNC